jgi:hypothetical protein
LININFLKRVLQVNRGLTTKMAFPFISFAYTIPISSLLKVIEVNSCGCASSKNKVF